MKPNSIILDSVFNKLKKTRERPEIYFGEKSLFLLKAYFDGYIDRQHEIDGKTYVWVVGFQEFVQSRYNITSTQNWSSIIRFYSTSNSEAFDRFYELLDEYFELNGIV